MKVFNIFKKQNVSEDITDNNYATISKEAHTIYDSVGHPIFTPDNIETLASNEFFVFGSNLAGRHEGGAAKVALNKFGAIYGQGVGIQGQSYAIPTMQGGVETIAPYVDNFISFAQQNKDKFFYVTRIGCGIAGFKEEQIAPLFCNVIDMSNVALPKSFATIIRKK